MKRVLQLALWIFVAAMIAVAVLLYPIFTEAQRAAAFTKVKDAQPPLSMDAVEKLMGSPARSEHSESTGLTADTYHYADGDREMKIVFFNGAVFHSDIVAVSKS